MLNHFTIVNEVVLGSIFGGFLGYLFYQIIDRRFFQTEDQIKSIDYKKFMINAVLLSAFWGLFMGAMAFTVVSFDPKNIEGYNFIGVFICAFFTSSSSVFTELILLAFAKVVTPNNNN